MDEQDLWAKQQISEALFRYARGVDRVDAALIKSAFWPDATDNHGTFTGNAHAFADYLMTSLSHFVQTSHVISNILVELDGEAGRGECYVTAYHEIEGKDDTLIPITLGGRYLDRFERRGVEWKIAKRLFVLDWLSLPQEAAHLQPVFDKITVRGARSPNDPWDRGEPHGG